ncbi:MAG: hypothetical protein BBJ57_05420 [Desulfobacterales bacterium PC51MH44]|nr:MAG: hypothetical protein BBJ57_05420 [Desulfobacterales bacterium PC51MH44]
MASVPCPACSTFFVPRNKAQSFCSEPGCQRARKALWQKQKLASDPDYKEGQRLSQKKWLQNNPGYWKKYRRRNPEKAGRNRSLQKIRNMKQPHPPKPSKTIGIAKMDARKSSLQSLSGQYWLVPTVAKMDAVKIFIATVPVNPP